jgi:hypothetical protein
VTGIADTVRVERTEAPGTCPECGAEVLQRYKVLATGGWFEVVKCQACLASVERRPWNRLGHVDRDHGLAFEDASRS